MTTTTDTDLETVEAFRARARTWLDENFPRAEEEARSCSAPARARRRSSPRSPAPASSSGCSTTVGFAGVCFPKEYGGQGLTPDHQRALNEESVGYDIPLILQVPTFVPCAAVLLEFGTEEQKLRHIPAILKGEEIWMQFLSEPSGGSDVAGRAHHRGARRRRVGRERLQDLDHRRVVLRLRALPPAHELGRAQAPRPQRVHHQDPPAGHRAAPDRDDQRLARSSARSSSPTCGCPTPTGSVRSTRAGPSAPAGCSTRRTPWAVARRTSPATCTPTGCRARASIRWSSWPGPPAASTTPRPVT